MSKLSSGAVGHHGKLHDVAPTVRANSYLRKRSLDDLGGPVAIGCLIPHPDDCSHAPRRSGCDSSSESSRA